MVSDVVISSDESPGSVGAPQPFTPGRAEIIINNKQSIAEYEDSLGKEEAVKPLSSHVLSAYDLIWHMVGENHKLFMKKLVAMLSLEWQRS